MDAEQQKKDEAFMRRALALAAEAGERGEIPVGAVIVHAGRIIARASNQVEMLHDATAHAEMVAITQAEAGLQGNKKSRGRAYAPAVCCFYVVYLPLLR